MKKPGIIWHLRAGLSYWLLSKAYDVAPEGEKNRLAVWLTAYFRETVAVQAMRKDIADLPFNKVSRKGERPEC